MRRVTRHITREILAPAISALVVATFLMLTTQILRVGEAAFGYGLGLLDFFTILALLLPRFLVFALPLSVMVGVLAALGRLTVDRELLAMRAAGLSPLGLWPAPVMVGLIASLVTLGLTTFGEPAALDGLTRRMAAVVERNLAAGLEPGVIHQEIPGVVLHAKERAEDGSLVDVFLHMELEAGRATLAARRARLDATGGRGIHLSLIDGEMIRAGASPGGGPDAAVIDIVGDGGEDDAADSMTAAARSKRLDRVRFESASIDLDVADTVVRRSRFIGSLDDLSILELHRYMNEDPRAWERRRAKGAFHRRLAMGFSCLSLSFLGLGMALFFGRPGTSGRGAGFAGGLGALFGYYVLLRVAENLAASGKGPAAALLWSPNALAMVLGGIFLFMAVRR